MKLDLDCFRDLMLEFEEKLPAQGSIMGSEFEKYEVFKKYEHDNVYYCLEQARDAGFVEYKNTVASNNPYYFLAIRKITYAGHQFLQNIKNDSIWKKTKQKLTELGGTASISIVTKIAEQAIKAQMGL